MKVRWPALVLTGAMLAAAVGAGGAAEVYRCGNTYGPRPCAEGRRLDIADERTREQHAAALRIATAEQRRAAALERERLQRERALRPAAAGRLDRPAGPAVAAPITLPKHATKRRRIGGGPLPDGDFIATDPSIRKKRGAS